jgi:uncharacterized membrane protein YdbT with pleckstrin-like domain
MASAVDAAGWLHLSEGEEILWTDRPSLYPAVPALLVGLALAVAGVWLARTGALAPVLPLPEPVVRGVALAPVPVGLVVAGWLYLHRWGIRYVLTTEEVYEKTGVLSRNVSQVRLERIQNTAFEQRTVERLLGYGDVRVYTAGSGGTDLVLTDVPDPGRVSAILTEQLDASAGGTSSPRRNARPAGEDRSTL